MKNSFPPQVAGGGPVLRPLSPLNGTALISEREASTASS